MTATVSPRPKEVSNLERPLVRRPSYGSEGVWPLLIALSVWFIGIEYPPLVLLDTATSLAYEW